MSEKRYERYGNRHEMRLYEPLPLYTYLQEKYRYNAASVFKVTFLVDDKSIKKILSCAVYNIFIN